MKTFKNILTDIDYVSFAPSLYTNQSLRYKSTFGGTVQLILICLYFAGVIFFSQDIYHRTNPEVIVSSGIINDPPLVDLTNNFNFILTLISFDNIPIVDESIYTVEFVEFKINNNSTETRTLKSGLCSLDYFNNQDKTIIPPSFNFNLFYCVSPEEKVQLKGSLNTGEVYYLKSYVKQCNNKTSPIPCKDQSIIDQTLSGFGTLLYYIDKYYDPNDFANPIKEYFNGEANVGSNKMHNSYIVYFNTLKFIDDIGFVFEALDYNQALVIDKITRQTDYQISDTVVEVMYIMNYNLVNVKRRYKRIQEVVAQVGGLMNGLSIIIKTVFSYFSHFGFIKFIAKNNFVIEEKGNDKGKENENETKLKGANNSKVNSHLSVVPSENKINILNPNRNLHNNNDGNSLQPQRIICSPNDSNKFKRRKNVNFVENLNDVGTPNLPTPNTHHNIKHNQIKNNKLNLTLNRDQINHIIRAIVDPCYIIKLSKEVELIKMLLLNSNCLQMFDDVIKSNISSNFLLSEEKKFPIREINEFSDVFYEEVLKSITTCINNDN